MLKAACPGCKIAHDIRFDAMMSVLGFSNILCNSCNFYYYVRFPGEGVWMETAVYSERFFLEREQAVAKHGHFKAELFELVA